MAIVANTRPTPSHAHSVWKDEVVITAALNCKHRNPDNKFIVSQCNARLISPRRQQTVSCKMTYLLGLP